MKTLIPVVLAACLLAVSSVGHCASMDKDVGQAWLRASIVLDATGKLTSIEWLDAKPNDRLVTKPLEAVVRGWDFEPGRRDGVPVVTRTGLSLHVKVEKAADGGLALNIEEASTGIINQMLSPPAYPLDQAKRGASAYVLLSLETDENGKVATASVTGYESSSTSSTSREDFEAAARKAAYSWTYLPENVGGTRLRAKVDVPITFCIDSWCSKRERRLAASGKPVVPSGTSLALDSAVKIISRSTHVEI